MRPASRAKKADGRFLPADGSNTFGAVPDASATDGDGDRLATLARRYGMANGLLLRLTGGRAEDVDALNALLARVESVSGNPTAATRWMRTNIPALQGLSPLQSLEKPGGMAAVSDVLGRIEAAAD